jgi:hypothetical protein
LQLRGSHMESHPYVSNEPPCPIHTPYTTPLAALASHLFYPPAPSPRDHSPRPPATRIVYPNRASTPPLATASRTARSLWRLNHRVPASKRTHRVYVSASRMHQHRRMWVAARRTRCRSRGVRAEREGGVRELAVQRVAGRHSGNTDTLRVHKEAYVLPPRRTELSRSPMSQRGRTPRADASLRVARHLARVKGRARCIYTAQQLIRAAHQP